MNEFADLVLTHGVIYTADEWDSVAEAIAVKEGRIVFVGSNERVQTYIGAETAVIHLHGKMVVPGFIDTHMHPPGLSLSELYEVQLSGDSLEGYLQAITDFVRRHPDIEAIYGRGWSWGAFCGDELAKGPRKEYLDAITTSIPVILRANDGHSLWVNSRALTVNGISRATADPEGGVIERDVSTGEVWGVLKESAMRLIAQPGYTLEQYTAAMLAFQAKMHRFGITGLLCIAGYFAPHVLEAFAQLEQAGELTLRVRGAVAIRPERDLAGQFDEIEQLRKRYRSPYLQITTAKFFTDGVVEGATSHLLEPYCAEAGKGTNHYGRFLWEESLLQQAFILANQRNLQIYVHSTGDASTRKVLDALAEIRTKVPAGDYRNTITHLQVVAPDDVQRFKALQVIASVQPYWHFKGPNWWESVDYRILGERAAAEYPLGSFFAAGATVTSSSDYPVTNIPNPLRAIEIGVTRNIDEGSLYGVEDITDINDERYLLNPRERATVRQMLASFTRNAAYALFMERETGSLEAGKLADMAVLDQNILAVEPVDIAKTRVVMTFVDGRLVYGE